jgi:hypothetical protein
MATYTTSIRGSTNPNANAAMSGAYGQPFICYTTTLDLADVLVAAGTNAFSNGDIIETIRLSAGSYVVGVGARVLQAFNTNACTIQIGDTGGSNFMDSCVASNTTGTLLLTGSNGNTIMGTGKMYRVADTIDVTFTAGTATLVSGVLQVWAWVGNPASLPRTGNVNPSAIAETVP